MKSNVQEREMEQGINQPAKLASCMGVGLPGFEPGSIGPEPTRIPSYPTDPLETRTKFHY